MGTYLGQNFLKDTNTKNFIADKVRQFCEKQKIETIIEIGPGKGAITRKICGLSSNFFVIETDPKMIEILQNLEENTLNNTKKLLKKEQIIHQSIIDFSISGFFKKHGLDSNKTLIVGNLPYYITSPILRMFFGDGKQKFSTGIFMVQEEVGRRISSDTKKKSFLRRLVNYAYNINYLKTVPARAFSPSPKVKSCLISLTPKPKTEIPQIKFDELYNVLDFISGFKRKTLGKIQKLLAKKGQNIIFSENNNNIKQKRLEELSREDVRTIFLENK